MSEAPARALAGLALLLAAAGLAAGLPADGAADGPTAPQQSGSAPAPTEPARPDEGGSSAAAETASPAREGATAAGQTARDEAESGPVRWSYGGEGSGPSEDARTVSISPPAAPAEGQVDIEALADRGRCQQARIMGLYVAYASDAAPEGGHLDEGRWYWGIEDPRDNGALDCLTDPDEAASAPGSSPPSLPGSPSPALAGDGPARPAADGGEAVRPGGDGGEPDGDEPGTHRRTSASQYQSPPPGPGTTAAAGLALALLAVPAAVVLYRKIRGDTVLENETRKRVLELVLERPGITAAEASDELDIHYRTARHHLEKLEHFDKIVGKRLRGRIRYFENHEKFGRLQKRVISCLDSETKRDVLMEIARSGAVRSGEVADRVDVAPSTASHHLQDLEEMDLVSGRREGRSVLYALEDGVLPALLDVAPDPERA